MEKNKQPEDIEDVKADQTIRFFHALVVIVIGAFIGYFVYQNAVDENAKHPFKLGLDLAGGAHLVYEADVSSVDAAEVPALMSVLRDVIERRVNVFGVSEPIVQVEQSSFVTGEERHRLVVELPGVTNVQDAIAEIGRTPLLEFKLVDQEAAAAQAALEEFEANSGGGIGVGNVQLNGESIEDPYIETGLTGRYLKSAALAFAGQQSGGLSNDPIVSIQFNEEGAQLFEQITRDNTGEQLAIFLDGELLSAPRINEAIAGGNAVISGGFDPEEAKALAENLNFGALPVPISLQSTQTIDATLGSTVVKDSVTAGVVGILIISLFMIFWYRLPGVVAAIALVMYVVITLGAFQLIPVTLTAAGLAGFILSLGMAVDANVLVFERMKEEFRAGKSSREAAQIGFARAWLAIRDSNVTGLISAVILFWFGTSLIKGFALVLGLGTIVAMVSAITLTRTLLVILPDVKREDKGVLPYLFGVGFQKK